MGGESSIPEEIRCLGAKLTRWPLPEDYPMDPDSVAWDILPGVADGMPAAHFPTHCTPPHAADSDKDSGMHCGRDCHMDCVHRGCSIAAAAALTAASYWPAQRHIACCALANDHDLQQLHSNSPKPCPFT